MLRRLLAPLLGPRQVPGYAERIVRTASAFCSAWSQAEPMDLFNELYRLTLHTMGRSLIDEDPMWDERGQFWAGRQLLWDWITSQSGQGRRLAGAADPLRDNKVVAAVTTIQDVLDHLLEHRIGDASPPADMLSALMTANKRAGCPLSPADVRDQIVALLFAAHETTACALFWSLYLLDCHPHARQRLECELDEIAPRPAYDVTAFPYTLQVLKEAMRLYPPAGRQFRVTTTSTTLGEYHLPEGMPVTVCQYLLHRRKESFPEPERFDPERFAPAAPYPAAAYLPFGAGRRACLGRHYALLETQVLLAYLAGHFRFQFSGPARAQLSVTVRPQGRVMAVVRRRSR
jgi:cytochrome P450